MISGKKIGFIGGGQMCEAIFSGMVASGQVAAGDVLITDISAPRLEQLEKKYGVGTTLNDGANAGALQVIQKSEIVVFAVKPQFARPLLGGISYSRRISFFSVSSFSPAPLLPFTPPI